MFDHSAWPLYSKKNMLFKFKLTCMLSKSMERTGFPLRGLLHGFWDLMVNPGFILCYNLEREFWLFLISSYSSWHTDSVAAAAAAKW